MGTITLASKGQPTTAARHSRMRLIRGFTIVLLLTGSLFPALGPAPLSLLAALIAIPLVIHELARTLPVVHPIIPVTVILFGMFAVSILVINPSNDYGIEKATTFFTLTALGFLAASLIRDAVSLEALGAAWVITSAGLAIPTLVNYTGITRATVFDANPIWLSRAIGLGVIFTFWFWWNKKINPLLAVVAISGLLLGMLATGSRGPLLGVVVGVVVLAVVGHRFALRRFAAILAVGAGCLWALQRLPIFEGTRILYGDNSEGSDQLRGMFWHLSGDVIREHPMGVGFGNWANFALPPAQFTYPHNIFIEVFTESGVIIGALFLAIVGGIAIRLMRHAVFDPKANLVLALIAAETIAVSVSGDLNARTFFFLLGLGVVTPRLIRLADETPKDPTRTRQVGSRINELASRS
jgi:O-antigen ligase